ncbi:MAG: Hsp20/alpha crystallin family protein [Bacteroidales bacterium]|nr:Hsp20/alpha crystallin family protein [Bacteroidales bacterium]
MLPTRKLNGQTWLPDFFNDFFESSALDRINTKAPAINVIEDEKQYKLELAAPGLTKEDFKVHVNKDGNLVIEMERKREEKEEDPKGGRYLRREFSYSKFHQTLVLPENADKDGIEASVENGVLDVKVPKLQKAKVEDERRVIEVK